MNNQVLTVNGEAVQLIIETELETTLRLIKESKKQEIKQSFLQTSTKPIVDTGLGFSVDGGRENLQDFETGKKYSLPQVRASDNTMHNVTLADYDTIISAIEQNGISLYQRKWVAEALIDSATTEAEVSAITF